MKIVREGSISSRKLVTLKKTRTGKKSKIQVDHSHSLWKKSIFIVILTIILVLAPALIITFGPVPITVSEVYCTLLNRILPGYFFISESLDTIICLIRLPRIVGAINLGDTGSSSGNCNNTKPHKVTKSLYFGDVPLPMFLDH